LTNSIRVANYIRVFKNVLVCIESIYTYTYVKDDIVKREFIHHVTRYIYRLVSPYRTSVKTFIISFVKEVLDSWTAVNLVGQVNTEGGPIETLGDDVVIPDNIGDDYVVYVDALSDSPSSIVGYRNADTWYNAEGAEINDPDVLAVNEPYPAPWLKEGPDAELNSNAFRDYDPAVNIMPRISFSFNISDEAVFFAHYDILTQRPTSNNRFSPIDYLFIESRNSLISNPNLRPEKTIDYELGFQQVLTKTSSLKISAYYKEMRDMIQVRNFTGAYPRPYRAVEVVEPVPSANCSV
jgi:hypothetical protein